VNWVEEACKDQQPGLGHDELPQREVEEASAGAKLTIVHAGARMSSTL
jgi:hypothetical protein